MEHTPPKYFLTELNDGIQWLTDGHDFGIRPDALPALLSALEAIIHRFDGSEDGEAIEFDQARAAILAAKGNA